MESLKTVTGLLNSVLKASETAHAATETLNSVEEQLVKFFNAMHQEVTELVKQAEEDKARIVELESQIETYKARIAELESSKTEVPEAELV